jgi:hypothetical protein
MIRRHFDSARIVLSITMVGFAVSAAAEQRAVDASELARCAAIAGGNERLACYDALALVAVPGARIAPATVSGAAGGAVAAGQGAPAAGGSAAGGHAAPAAGGQAAATGGQAPAAVNGGGQSAAATGQPAAAAPSANLDDPSNFGLTRRQLKAVPTGPDSVKAIVSQITEDRLHNVSLVLDNGQTWGFVEPDPRVRPGDSVTIKRASLGSFLMMTPSRRSYRVERVK